jgi:hypothetical protein
MLDDDQLETHIRELIIDICEVLWARGYTLVPIGAMMRLVGVENERAAQHDSEYFSLDEDFQSLLESRKTPPPEPPPPGVTLH